MLRAQRVAVCIQQAAQQVKPGLQVGSCQNYGPLLGTPNNRCRTIIGTQKRDPNFDNHSGQGQDL